MTPKLARAAAGERRVDMRTSYIYSSQYANASPSGPTWRMLIVTRYTIHHLHRAVTERESARCKTQFVNMRAPDLLS